MSENRTFSSAFSIRFSSLFPFSIAFHVLFASSPFEPDDGGREGRREGGRVVEMRSGATLRLSNSRTSSLASLSKSVCLSFHSFSFIVTHKYSIYSFSMVRHIRANVLKAGKEKERLQADELAARVGVSIDFFFLSLSLFDFHSLLFYSHRAPLS